LPNTDFSKIKLIAFDFDGVFTDNAVWLDQNGIEMVRCSRADGIGLSMARSSGIDSIVISTEKNPVVSLRCHKLKIPCYQGVKNKKSKLLRVAEEKKLSLAQIAFVGNDVNDLDVMKNVGYPIAVADAEEEIRSISCFMTKKAGGYGAVREICEKVVLARKGKT
jgi:3-deoxy-D-manno-octulosonate 8-phosphate phosphatase (KDO 8-P phosphatase)